MKHSELVTIITKQKGKTPKQQEFADILNKPVNTISSRAARNAKYDFDEVQKLGNYYGINFYDVKNTQGMDNLINDLAEYHANSKFAETTSIDYYPDVFGSCGGGTFTASENKQSMQVPKSCIKSYSTHKHYSVINARGDSMQPFILDKDKLIVEHWKGEQIVDNRVYVFCIGDNLYVKRLVDNIDQIIVKSDNEMYPARFVNKKECNIHVIGQIVGLMREM